MKELLDFFKGLDSFKVRRNIFLTVMVFIVVVAVFQLYQAKPQVAYKFAAIAILAPIFIFIGRFIWLRLAAKCPLCGGVMEKSERIKIFKGALCKNSKKVFPAIGKTILSCDKCKNEYHELFYYTDTVALHKNYIEGYYRNSVVFKNEIPKGVNEIPLKSITEEEFEDIVETFVNEVKQINLRSGFTRRKVKIKSRNP